MGHPYKLLFRPLATPGAPDKRAGAGGGDRLPPTVGGMRASHVSAALHEYDKEVSSAPPPNKKPKLPEGC